MLELTNAPLFGVSLCLMTYTLSLAIKKRFNYTILNPLLLSAIMIIAVLAAFKIPLENFMVGGDFITMLMAPATAALALSMYRKLDTIKKYFLPIVVGSVVGATIALLSIALLCKLFNMPSDITASLLPKSITTAFATKLSEQFGGLVPITVAAVSVTGIFGAISAPYLIKLFKIKDPIAAGLAIGAASHALGTTKAIEIGETEGSASGIAVGLCGVVTVIIAIFL